MTESEKKDKLEMYTRGLAGIEIIIGRYREDQLDALTRAYECGCVMDAFRLRVEELKAARAALEAQEAEPDPPEPPDASEPQPGPPKGKKDKKV